MGTPSSAVRADMKPRVLVRTCSHILLIRCVFDSQISTFQADPSEFDVCWLMFADFPRPNPTWSLCPDTWLCWKHFIYLFLIDVFWLLALVGTFSLCEQSWTLNENSQWWATRRGQTSIHTNNVRLCCFILWTSYDFIPKFSRDCTGNI